MRNTYTQNGWVGKNFDVNLDIKEIAKITRKYIKDNYKELKAKVKIRRNSYCPALDVEIDSNTIELAKTEEELMNELNQTKSLKIIMNNVNELSAEEYKQRVKELLNDKITLKNNNLYSMKTHKTLLDIKKFINTYNYDDSDAMIDYFDTNFYLNIIID